MAYRLRFGSYDFPITLSPADENSTQDTAAQPRVRASGSVSQTGRREATTLLVRGALTAGTPNELETLHRALKKACYNGKQDLWFGRDDIYYKDVQCKAFGTPYEEGKFYGLLAAYSITFEAAGYPEAFDVTPVNTTLAAAGATVTVTGDAPPLPTWEIHVASDGGGPFTLTNETTGEQAVCFTGNGFVEGDVVLLQRDGYRVLLNGTPAFGLLQNRIPTLLPGQNVITLTGGAGASADHINLLYTPRYR